MLTDQQFLALKTIHKSGGAAVLDRYNRLVAAGEVLSFHPATVLRLCMSGHMEPFEGHVYVTETGRAVLEEA